MMQGDEDNVMDEVPLMDTARSDAMNPSCRPVRWYHQLLAASFEQSEEEYAPLKNSVGSVDLETTVVPLYENLQKQYSSLLLHLDENEDGNEKVDDISSKLSMSIADMDGIGSTFPSLDPLSAMLQEDDARVNRQREIEKIYERDRRRNKGRCGPYIPDEPKNDDTSAVAIAYKQLITKDLLRLSSPHRNERTLESKSEETLTERVRHLMYILFMFAISHPEAGYLQGMHEIASYCLYALETEEEFFLQKNDAFRAALSYWMTESIITSLYIAYDVTKADSVDMNLGIKIPKPFHQSTPLVQMSNRILQSLSLVDTTLYSILISSSQAIPYQLIFTKWIRLLFSREIVACSSMTHSDTVLFLWDALFDVSHKLSQMTAFPSINVPTLQTVSERFCVARLWHHTNTIQHLHSSSRTANSNFLLHWLMNIPPEPVTEVQKILMRLNFIITSQFYKGVAPDTLKTQQLLLPPLNAVPADVLAMTVPSMSRNHHVEVSSRQSTPQIRHNAWDSSSIGAGSFFQSAAAALTSQKDHSKALSSLAETITSKTQSIQKLITQEWENVQAQLIDSPMYDCGAKSAETNHASSVPRLFSAQQSVPSKMQNTYNLDYYNTNPSGPVVRPQSGNLKISERLQQSLQTIHEYVTGKEHQTPRLHAESESCQNRSIWDALAELQLLQQELYRNGL